MATEQKWQCSFDLGRVGEQTGIARDAGGEVRRVGGAADDTEQSVGQPETGLGYVLLLHWSLADEAPLSVEWNDRFAADTRTHLDNKKDTRSRPSVNNIVRPIASRPRVVNRSNLFNPTQSVG